MALLERVENLLLNEPCEATLIAKAAIKEFAVSFKTWLVEGFATTPRSKDAMAARLLLAEFLEEEGF